jgi:hypothetical protein
VIGSIYASVFSTRLLATIPAALPGAVTHAARQSVGAALTVASRLGASGHPALGGGIHQAAVHAFTHGLSVACLVAACVSAAGAAVAGLLLPAYPPGVEVEVGQPPPAAGAIPALD